MLGDDDIWRVVFDASNNPDQLSTIVDGLITAKYYTFRVFSTNFNGRSIPSNVFSVYACGMPTNFDAPTYVISTKTSITINWNVVKNDGGCTIFDYRVERDADGTGAGPWQEVNPDTIYPRNDPTIQQFTCTMFPAATLIGSLFKFRVIAFNLQGTVTSIESAALPLANIPGMPLAGP
jgi:hypothetical protein